MVDVTYPAHLAMQLSTPSDQHWLRQFEASKAKKLQNFLLSFEILPSLL